MKIEIIQVPYDSGHRSARMGRGPEHFVRNDLERMLQDDDHEVQMTVVEATSPFQSEIKTAFDLHKLVADRVRSAAQEGNFPLVLSGNCNASVGSVAGLGGEDLGIIWFDGHADFNTPETTPYGFLDGMGLAIATGDCWKRMARTIPGFRPISEANVVLVGSRDIDSAERDRLRKSDVTLVEADLIRRSGAHFALGTALDALHTRIRRLYVHVDLDVLDPGVAKANEFAPPDGLSPEDLEEAIRVIQDRFTISAAGIASYDPDYDEEGRTLRTGIRVMQTLTNPPGNER